MFSNGDNQRFLVLLPHGLTNEVQPASAPSSPNNNELPTLGARDSSCSPSVAVEETPSLPPTDQKFLSLVPHHRHPSVSSISTTGSSDLDGYSKSVSSSQSSASPTSPASDAGSDPAASSPQAQQPRMKFLDLVAERRYGVDSAPSDTVEQQQQQPQQKQRKRPEIVIARNAPTGAFLRLG